MEAFLGGNFPKMINFENYILSLPFPPVQCKDRRNFGFYFISCLIGTIYLKI